MGTKDKKTMTAYSQLLRTPEVFYLDTEYSLEQFAKDLHLNRTYASRFANNALGMPFRSLLSSLRLKHAVELMKYKEIPLQEIAKMSGFATDISFRRSFVKEFGINPSDSRK